MDKNFMNNYAELLVKVGLNVVPGEEILINSPLCAADLARAITLEAYKVGAKRVTCNYSDQILEKIRLQNEAEQSVIYPSVWQVEQKNYIVKHKCAVISIIADDPDLLKDVSPKLLALRSKTFSKKYEKYHNATMSNKIKWCIASYASPVWAKKVFPDLTEEEAVEKLWRYIATSMRMDEGNAVENWKQFQARTEKICAYLNEKQFDFFEYKSSNGTNLKVGMPENYRFSGAGEPSADGVYFVANMPTEECFSAPHRNKVDGIVYSALPLCANGNIISDFWLRFEQGKVVEFDAKEGKETLSEIIGTDEGSHYLGEIAFVEYDSPIRRLKTVFYETLFDENASCHLALGRGYSECVEGGAKMSSKKLLKKGVNFSMEHCDFMVGTRDLSVIGYKDGIGYPVIVNGNFAENLKNR